MSRPCAPSAMAIVSLGGVAIARAVTAITARPAATALGLQTGATGPNRETMAESLLDGAAEDDLDV